MTDTMQREIAEIERQRDAFHRLDVIRDVDRDVTVLKTRFEMAIDAIFKELERSVSPEDLKELKREMEIALRDAVSGMREHLVAANEQQSKNLLGQVQNMFQLQHTQIAEANRRTRVEILRYGVAFATSVLGALTVIWLTR